MSEQTGTVDADVLRSFEAHRRELCAYAYRMLGSSFEAEDAVQDAFTRAWKSYDSFEGRASLRSWLYKITTNICLDMLDRCTQNDVVSNFEVLNRAIDNGNELVDVEAQYSADVYTNNAGMPGMFLGQVMAAELEVSVTSSVTT